MSASGRFQSFDAVRTFTEIVSVSIADRAQEPDALLFTVNRMISTQTLYSFLFKPFQVNCESIASSLHPPA